MTRPTYRFDLEPDPRIGSPRDLCNAIPARPEPTTLSVWVCHAGKRIADFIGHIYHRIIVSTFADVAERCQAGTLWHLTGRVSFVSLDIPHSAPLSASRLTDGLRESLAWYLWIGHNRAPKNEPVVPSRKLRMEAQSLLLPEPVWSHRQVKIHFEQPGGKPPGERLFNLLGSGDSVLLQGWDPDWPERLTL